MGGPLRIPYSTSRGRVVGGHCASPKVLVGEAEWGGGGGTPRSLLYTKGKWSVGGTPRPLLLAGVNYKMMYTCSYQNPTQRSYDDTQMSHDI